MMCLHSLQEFTIFPSVYTLYKSLHSLQEFTLFIQLPFGLSPPLCRDKATFSVCLSVCLSLSMCVCLSLSLSLCVCVCVCVRE